MPIVHAEELDTLDLARIKVWNEDPSNGQRICLERARKELSNPHALDAVELGAKLQLIPPQCSPSPSSSEVTAGAGRTPEEWLADIKSLAYERRDELKSLNGIPSRMIKLYPGCSNTSLSDEDKFWHESDHWHNEAGHTGDELD
ncbi:MAG: hypothetical protein M1829_000416 [Trizodia sp. TS-e1964]|nr:MAG: hypothetical protein M1829_000416 [Trizodia sp. TS-e1964]